MKLWKRRPLSEDLTRKDLNIPDEMPPTLVYISPGNQRISKRSSLTNNEHLMKFESTTELNSFQVTENENHSENKPCSRNHHLQSFRDCECKSSVQFDDNYPKSANLPNKDCKSYFAPVSLEWYPVKDVMKICRSASVPFHSRHQSTKTDMDTTKVIETTELKSPHLSLSEKIRIFFRNRSSSRPTKPALGKITEAKPTPSPSNRNKNISRSSRSRMKDSERCKSLYESSRTSDNEYLQRLNNILKTNNSQSIYLSNGNGYMKQNLGTKDKKNDEKRLQSGKMEKVEKKGSDVADNQKRTKAQISNSGSSQRVLVREFSSSVVSHTTSSAAKCRSPPPKTPETNPNYQKSKRQFEKNILSQTGEVFATNLKKKSSVIYDCPDFGTTDPSLSNRPSQVMIVPRSDKRNGNLTKSDALSTRSGRFDSRGYKQNSEYLLPRKLAPPVLNSADLRPTGIGKPQISNKNIDDEDDYVRLAEVITTPPPSCAFMTQSLYASYLPDYSPTILTNENDEVHIQKPQNYHGHQKDTILLKNKHRLQPASGEIRKRPISCMAVVNADCRILPSDTDHGDRHGGNYPKSPYLSQYSKLYSLRTNGREMVNRYGYDMADTDLMSRSQHSGHYKMPVAISKDQAGKLSIDSGLVDDINASHSECIQQVQNY